MAKKKKKVVVVVKPKVPPKKDISAKQKVKIATSNLFILDQPIDSTDAMADAIIEDIGGQEIINISRTDLLNGQNVTYNVIENLESTQRKFNPNELIKLQATDAEYFGSFQLDLNNFLVDYGTGPSGDSVYVDPDTGDVIINTVNVSNNLVVEVEFVSYQDIASTEV
jgi:hypothetical protein